MLGWAGVGGVGWGGVGWGGVGGCSNVHVCCLTCDATLMLRSCLGGVGWDTPVQLTQCGDLLNNKCQVPCPAR